MAIVDVKFKRKTQLEIDTLPIEDGNIIFNTDKKEILMDNGSVREKYSGNVETDKTLTKEGIAADAKVVGDNLKDFSKKSNNLFDLEKINVSNLYLKSTGEMITNINTLSVTLRIGQALNKYLVYKNFELENKIDGIIYVLYTDEIPTVGKTYQSKDISGVDNSKKTIVQNIKFNTKYMTIGFSFKNKADAVIESIYRSVLLLVESSVVPDIENIKYIPPNIIDVTEKNLSENMIKERIKCIENIDFGLGEELFLNAFFDEGNWTANGAGGFVHTLQKNGSLAMNINGNSKGNIYLFEFDTTYAGNEFCKVGFGNVPKALVYNGTTHISIPLYSDGGILRITPFLDFDGTLSNFSIKQIVPKNHGLSFENKSIDSILSFGHDKNLGFWNVALGYRNFAKAISGTRTVAIGNDALRDIVTGHRNIGIGTFSMSQMKSGENNVSIGADAMLAVQEADRCIAIGKAASYNGQEIADNISIGEGSLYGGTDSKSSRNVSVGTNSGYKTKGNGNVFVGYQSGYRNITGNNNILIGHNAFGESAGNNNVCIGDDTGYATGTNNSIAIGHGVKCNKSNQVKVGNENTEEFILGNKKIKFNSDGSVTWENV